MEKKEDETAVKNKHLRLKVTAELSTVNVTSKDALRDFVRKMQNLTGNLWPDPYTCLMDLI